MILKLQDSGKDKKMDQKMDKEMQAKVEEFVKSYGKRELSMDELDKVSVASLRVSMILAEIIIPQKKLSV